MTTITNLDEVKAATTKELVAFYNAHNVDKPVAKFADRKTAERRVMAILEVLITKEQTGVDADIADVDEAADKPVVHKTRASRQVAPQAEHSFQSDTPEDEVSEEEALAELALMKAHAAKQKTSTGTKSGLTLSAAIAASWNDPEVADKRKTRHSVEVKINGKTGSFKSVRTAFAELKLPDAKHIRFRMKLKESGSAIFEWEGQKYHFTLVASVE